MEFPVCIEIRRSVLLFCVLILVHLVAAACVASLVWAWYWRGILLALAALSLYLALRPARVSHLYLINKDRAEATLLSGERVEISVLPQTTVFAVLLVLRLKVEAIAAGDDCAEGDSIVQKVVSLTLVHGQLSAENFRKLSLWLRWHSVSDDSDNLPKSDEPTS